MVKKMELDTVFSDEIFKNSLRLLFRHAQSDTGGSKRCAQFLLGLWNGTLFKADIQDLLYTDIDINRAMLCVLYHLHGGFHQLNTYVSKEQITPIIDTWGDAFRVKKL